MSEDRCAVCRAPDGADHKLSCPFGDARATTEPAVAQETKALDGSDISRGLLSAARALAGCAATENEPGEIGRYRGLSQTCRDASVYLDVLVSERDVLRAEIEGLRLEYAGALDNHAEVRDALRAEDAERDCAALREGLAKAHEQYDASQARVRELEARPATVRDDGARAALEAVTDALRRVAWTIPGGVMRDEVRARVMGGIDKARVALNGDE
jgi:hypothetical protein